jgi:hypothetical protein
VQPNLEGAASKQVSHQRSTYSPVCPMISKRAVGEGQTTEA